MRRRYTYSFARLYSVSWEGSLVCCADCVPLLCLCICVPVHMSACMPLCSRGPLSTVVKNSVGYRTRVGTGEILTHRLCLHSGYCRPRKAPLPSALRSSRTASHALLLEIFAKRKTLDLAGQRRMLDSDETIESLLQSN